MNDIETGVAIAAAILVAGIAIGYACEWLNRLVDSQIARWAQRQRLKEWSRRYGKGPHGD